MPNTQGILIKTPEYINSQIIVGFNEGLNQCPWWKSIVTAEDDAVPNRMRFGRAEDKHLVWSDADCTKLLHSSQDQDMILSNGMHDFKYEEYRKKTQVYGYG